MEEECPSLSVPCLYNLLDLQLKCEKEKVQLSKETNRYLLYTTLRKLGPLTSQKLIKRLVQRGEIEWDKEEDFEVEAILNYHCDPENGKQLYFIKWKNWTHEHNTWEPREHLECGDLLDKFHKTYTPSQATAVYAEEEVKASKHQKIDEMMERIFKTPEITSLKLLRASESPIKSSDYRYSGVLTNGPRTFKPKPPNKDISNKRSKAHRDLKREIKLALKDWETSLNTINTDPAPIMVENNVDLEGPPEQFSYLNDYKPMDGVFINEDPVIGCDCTSCFDEKKNCCAANTGCSYAYYKNSRVRVPPGLPIYECNKKCKCPPSCPNRVVQYGRKHKVCIFRTHNGRGWGVKAMQKIKKGCFVMEYVGEVITNEEAERRGLEYDAEGRTYLFDLDYNDADCPYTVDAGFYGNESHFVNHSCDPNLAVYGVWINNLDPSLPRIALFSKRDICSGEELTFDYLMTGDTTVQNMDVVDNAEQHINDGENVPTSSNTSTTDAKVIERTDSDTAMSTDARLAVDSSDSEFKIPLAIDIPPKVVSADQTSVSDQSESDAPSRAESEMDTESGIGDEMDEPNPFIRRSGSKAVSVSPSPAAKYRLMCQCGAANCRKYLY